MSTYPLNYQKHVYPFLPVNRCVPSLYFIRARRLLSTNQNVWPGSFELRSQSSGTIDSSFLMRQFQFDYSRQRPSLIHSFCCPGCGSVGHSSLDFTVALGDPTVRTSSVPPRPYCSDACDLAVRLFYFDCLALAGLPTHRAKGASHSPSYDPWPIGAFEDLFATPDSARRSRTTKSDTPSNIPLDHRGSIIAGRFARQEGIFYLSSLLMPIHTLTLALRELMSKNDLPTIEGVVDAARSEQAVPALPAETGEGGPSLPSPGSVGAPGLDSLKLDPVIARASQLVLGHLETADAFLSGKAEKPWDKEQVKVFLGLFQRVTPTLSASLNVSTSTPPRSPHEMSREELQAAIAARKSS
jgi:hypothetical protein